MTGQPRKVVIVGGGHAGVRCAQELARRRRPSDNIDVILVSRENTEVWHGLMPQILSGVLQPQHVLVPLREFLPGVRVYADARLERTGDRVGDGRYVAAPAKLLGTHRAPLEGLPATNRFVVVHCVFYCELGHDRLRRVRAFFDLYDAATQLGVLPGRGTLGEKALLMLRGFGLRTPRG